MKLEDVKTWPKNSQQTDSALKRFAEVDAATKVGILEHRLGLAVAALEWYAETNNGGMGLARETLAQIEKGKL